MGSLRVIEGGAASGTDIGVATYIWLDRACNICSRTKVISVAKSPNGDPIPLVNRWKMVGAVESTESGKGEAWVERYGTKIKTKTFILSPCNYVPDPLRAQPSFIVLCESRDLADIPDPWNARARLRKLVEGKDVLSDEEPEKTPARMLGTWWGIQQHFHSLVGYEEPTKSEIKEKFLLACIDSGLRIHSTDDKHYWFGPRSISDEIDGDEPGPLVIADHLIVARFIYKRLLTEHGILDSGVHMPCSLYVSTKESRNEPALTQDLTVALQGLKEKLPDRLYIPAHNEQQEKYRAGLNQQRPSISWEAELSEGLAVNTGGLNYTRISGPPGNVDPYEAMFRILDVLLATQEKPSEKPAPEGG